MWVDGPKRRPDQVDPDLRSLVAQMQRRAFELQLPVWEDAEEHLLAPDLPSRLAELRASTLVLVGGDDVSDMHEMTERLASGIPGARKVEVAGTTHLPSLERPEEFNRLVLAFLGVDATAA
jgi:3-oxoadipate enol-lactonase